jgi:hypothetical protein
VTGVVTRGCRLGSKKAKRFLSFVVGFVVALEAIQVCMLRAVLKEGEAPTFL